MLDEQITCLVPTSAIPSHPATYLIEECISGIRHYFPTAKVIIMADEVRPQLEHRRGQYNDYKKNLRVAVSRLTNVELSEFTGVSQQGIMTRKTLDSGVKTPLVLFCEHDAILRPEPPLEIEAMLNLLLSGDANIVRLYNWGDIWHEHEYLMRGKMAFNGYSRFTKTVQFSGWPLFARADYLRMMFGKHFPPHKIVMLESQMYGPVCASCWEEHKIVIYADGTPGFTHRDGRTDPVSGRRDPGEW
jgi:hypothetical protein